jgi:putative resolvase
MKLSAWARRQGVHYNTALRWVTNNTMPVAFERTATGTILVKEFVGESGNSLDLVALYARVSGSGQKSDLEAQLGRISVFAATKKSYEGSSFDRRNRQRVKRPSAETDEIAC